MLTQLDDSTLIRYGIRYRTRYLVEQARYTLKLAQSESPPLELPPGYLSLVEAAISHVESSRDDKELAAVESKLATSRQNAAAAEAKVWRRKVTNRAHRASRFGASIPKELLTVVRTNSVPKLLENVGTMVRLLSEYASELSYAGAVEPLIDEGQSLYDALSELDADQEVKRLAELPARVRALYRSRGELYVAIKIIHDAGREKYVRDSDKASRYTLRILHRRGTKRSGSESDIEGESM